MYSSFPSCTPPSSLPNSLLQFHSPNPLFFLNIQNESQPGKLILFATHQTPSKVSAQIQSNSDFPVEEENPILEKRNSKPHVEYLPERIKLLLPSQKLETIQRDGGFQSISVFNDFLMKNEPIEAKRILYQMIETGFQPNVADFTDLINSFCKRGRLHDAIEVFGVMGKVKCEPTIYTYNCVLKGLCYLGRVEEAYKLLSKIKKSTRKPDIYTYTAVMDGFCKVGRSNEAMELLDEAIGLRLVPNVVVYNTLLNGYFREGRPLEGVGLLQKMKERVCLPDYISYNTLLHGLLKWGKIRAGLRIYKEMMKVGYKVDGRLMNSLLRGLCRRSRKDKGMLIYAYEVFDKMSSEVCDIHPCARELVIEAFCNGNEIDKAYVNLCEMVTAGFSLRAFTFVNVIRGLSVEGKVEAALSVLVLMYAGGGIPSTVTFNVLISALNRQGMVSGAACVYSVALKRGVVPKSKPRGSPVIRTLDCVSTKGL